MWRFRCADCGKTFTRLPPFLFPFKHYMVKEIEGVMRHLCDGGQLSQAPSAAEESTLRRWWKEYRAKMQEWAGLLESRTYEPSCQRSQHYQALYPSSQETGNDLIPVTAFTSALGSDGQGTILAEYIPPTLP